jgi:hypothetical protein
MKLFIDSADPAEIRQALSLGAAEGVTTNPTLILKSGVTDLDSRIREIALLVPGPVNAEVTSTTVEGIVEEGKRFATLGKNVHVKIPLNHEGLVACRLLTQQGIPCTLTLVFSAGQAILAAAAGAAWICPFVGRLILAARHRGDLRGRPGLPHAHPGRLGALSGARDGGRGGGGPRRHAAHERHQADDAAPVDRSRDRAVHRGRQAHAPLTPRRRAWISDSSCEGSGVSGRRACDAWTGHSS